MMSFWSLSAFPLPGLKYLPVDRRVIRRANPSEASLIAALIQAAYRDYAPKLGRDPQPMTDDYAELIDAGDVWVLDDAGNLDGVLVIQLVDSSLLIRTVGIAPHRQRQGLGTRLMAEAECLAVAADIHTLRLYTNEVMTGNVELYARLGYAETHRTGPDGKQVIYMTKELK
jgi:GNAT superfamily N-acetyltransferase